MALTLEQMKVFLKVTDSAEDDLITAQTTAAAQYLKGQTSKTKHASGTDTSGNTTYTAIEEDLLFQQAVKLMVAHWYENRAVVVSGTIVTKIDFTVDAIIQHISCCGDYE